MSTGKKILSKSQSKVSPVWVNKGKKMEILNYKDADHSPITSPLNHAVNMEKGWLSHLCFFLIKLLLSVHIPCWTEKVSPSQSTSSAQTLILCSLIPALPVGLVSPTPGPSVISDISLLPPHLWVHSSLIGRQSHSSNGDHACKHWGWGEKAVVRDFTYDDVPGGPPLTYLHHSLTIVYEGALFSKMTQFPNYRTLITLSLLFIVQEDAALLLRHKGE